MVHWWHERRVPVAIASAAASLLIAWLFAEPSLLLLAVASITFGIGRIVGLGVALCLSVVAASFPVAGDHIDASAVRGFALSVTCMAAWFVTTIFVQRADLPKAGASAVDAGDSHLRQLIDAFPAQIWTADPTGAPTHVNTALVQWSGLSIDDLREGDAGALATAIHRAIHPDDRLDVASILSEAFRSGNAFALKYRQRHSDGAYRWIDGRAGPLRAADGTIRQWYGVCLDIDDQVRAHESLHQRERELRHLVDTVPALIWLLTPQGETLGFNRKMVEWVGLTPDALSDIQPDGCQLTIGSLIHPDDRPRAQAAFSMSLQTGEPLQVRGRLRRYDGEYRWVESRVAPLRDDAGDIVQWYGVSFEVEDEVRAVHALQESEQYLRQVIDTVPVVVFRATGEGKPVYANGRIREFYGFQHENLDDPDSPGFQTAVQLLVHPDDRAEVERDLARAFESGNPFRKRYRQHLADGGFRWIEGRMEPLRDSTGAILEWYGVNLDVDDEVHAQEDLIRARQKLAKASQAASLSELSASIAHEVNQPLAAISANASACHQWLLHEPPNLARARETAEAMIADAEAAANIVGRVRALFSTKTKVAALNNVNDIVLEVCRLLASEIAGRGVKIERELCPDLQEVLIDRVQIQQVLVNLIRNGLEAMESVPISSRILHIRSLNLINGDIRIDICDVGPGIADSHRIFEPFFTTKADGLGMGLSICKSIVDSHGGKILVDSAKGQTVFSVFLPHHQDKQASAENPTSKRSSFLGSDQSRPRACWPDGGR